YLWTGAEGDDDVAGADGSLRAFDIPIDRPVVFDEDAKTSPHSSKVDGEPAAPVDRRVRRTIFRVEGLCRRSAPRDRDVLGVAHPWIRTRPEYAAGGHQRHQADRGEPCCHRMSVPHELGEQAVEVVHAAFAGGGVTAAVVKARPHSALHRLDDRLILALDPVEARAGA